MTTRDALEWARNLVLRPGETLPPWPPGLARVICRCGAPWFECCHAADLNPPGPELPFVLATFRLQPRARA